MSQGTKELLAFMAWGGGGGGVRVGSVGHISLDIGEVKLVIVVVVVVVFVFTTLLYAHSLIESQYCKKSMRIFYVNFT